MKIVYWTQRTLLEARLRRYSLRGTAAAAAADAAAAAAVTAAAEDHVRVRTDGDADAVQLSESAVQRKWNNRGAAA